MVVLIAKVSEASDHFSQGERVLKSHTPYTWKFLTLGAARVTKYSQLSILLLAFSGLPATLYCVLSALFAQATIHFHNIGSWSPLTGT